MNAREAVTAAHWMDRAALDLEDARAVFQSRCHRFDNVAFLCQQCVEKLIKAFRVCHRVPFPKVHDIARLLEAFVSRVDSELAKQAEFTRNLNAYAVAVRYPELDETIDADTAQLLIHLMERAWALFEPRVTSVLGAEERAQGPEEAGATEPHA